VIGAVVVVVLIIVVVIVEYLTAARFSITEERARVPLSKRAKVVFERYILVVILNL